MGILKKVLGQHSDETEERSEIVETNHECPHTSLVPHWDSPDEMGKSDKATYRCEACGRVFNSRDAERFLNKPPEAVASIPRDR